MKNTQITKTEVAKFKKVKTLVDLQNDPRVDSVWNEDNSWWCLLVDGYEWAPNSQLIHETTIKSVCSVMNHEVKAVQIASTEPQLTEQEQKTLDSLLNEVTSNENRSVGYLMPLEKKRTDTKTHWCWDFKVNGKTFWADSFETMTEGVWRTYFFADEDDNRPMVETMLVGRLQSWVDRKDIVLHHWYNLQKGLKVNLDK